MALNFANNNSLSAVTSLPASISGGDMTLLQTQTASSSATIDFTSNIDSTYDVYLFKIINCHPSSDEVDFSFQGSTNGGSSFGVTMTSTGFSAYHKEDGSSSGLGYEGQLDQAQGTGFHQLSYDTSYDNDHCICGELFLYNPSSTTFLKHFKLRASNNHYQNFQLDSYGAGYFNTTSAINGIQFKFGSGNIDSGVIKLYGIS